MHAPGRDELARVLEELGYPVTVDREVDDAYVTAALREGRIHTSIADVGARVLAPSQYLAAFSCEASAPIGWPCDESLDARLNETLALQTTDMAAAAATWAEVDRAAVDLAIDIPLFNSGGDFVSERVGNVQIHPSLFVLLDQLWVQ